MAKHIYKRRLNKAEEDKWAALYHNSDLGRFLPAPRTAVGSLDWAGVGNGWLADATERDGKG